MNTTKQQAIETLIAAQESGQCTRRMVRDIKWEHDLTDEQLEAEIIDLKVANAANKIQSALFI